jgi:hypothetical protein
MGLAFGEFNYSDLLIVSGSSLHFAAPSLGSNKGLANR